MRRSLFIVPLALALAACGSSSKPQQGAAPTPTNTNPAESSTSRPAGPTPFEVLNNENNALNQGNVAASIAYFAPNAVLITPLGGCNPCLGQAAIREHWSGAAANQVKVTLSEPKTVGDIVTVNTTTRSAQFPNGINRVIGTAIVAVRAGKITRLDQRYDTSDAQTQQLLALAGVPPTSTNS